MEYIIKHDRKKFFDVRREKQKMTDKVIENNQVST
mgnify:CR=1 FL=1